MILNFETAGKLAAWAIDIHFVTYAKIKMNELDERMDMPTIYPEIKFIDFNNVRNLRGVDAARFDIKDEDGEEYWLWMSPTDIKKNMMQFPHCRRELEKGLQHYNMQHSII